MGEESNMDTDDRVILADIRGDIKRIFDRHEQYGKDMARAERDHRDGMNQTNLRLNNHSERLTSLEGSRQNAQGEQVGTAKAVKIAYAVAGTIAAAFTALGAALLRAWGV